MDDQSCVLVYENAAMAAAAYNALQKSSQSEHSDDLQMALCHPLRQFSVSKDILDH